MLHRYLYTVSFSWNIHHFLYLSAGSTFAMTTSEWDQRRGGADVLIHYSLVSFRLITCFRARNLPDFMFTYTQDSNTILAEPWTPRHICGLTRLHISMWCITWCSWLRGRWYFLVWSPQTTSSWKLSPFKPSQFIGGKTKSFLPVLWAMSKLIFLELTPQNFQEGEKSIHDEESQKHGKQRQRGDNKCECCTMGMILIRIPPCVCVCECIVCPHTFVPTTVSGLELILQTTARGHFMV